MRKFFSDLFKFKKSATPPKAQTFWSRFVDGAKMILAGAALGAGGVILLFGRTYYKIGLVVAPVAAALCIGMGLLPAAEAWMGLALLAWSIKFGYEATVWLEQLVEKLWPVGGQRFRYQGVNARGEYVYE